MDDISSKHENWLIGIDFSKLMDLRVDYAFKLLIPISE